MRCQFRSRSLSPEWKSCWWLFGIALGLLLWVDLATTIAAAHFYGLNAEANPIMRALLELGMGHVLVVHLLIFIMATIGFHFIILSSQSLEPAKQMQFRSVCVCWIGFLIVVGICIAANNIALVMIAVTGS